MGKKTYSKEEFQAMVAELESEFMNLLKSEQEAAQLLAKSEETAEEEKEEKEEKKEESKEESKVDKAESEEKQEESESEDKKDEEKKEEQKEEQKEEEEDESHGYDEEDMEEMYKMYSSMSKGELKAHKDSIEKCWLKKCGEITQMNKSEAASSKNDVSDLLKSELESIKKENETLKKNIEGLVAAINTYVTKKQAPVRKAITDIEFVKKSDEGSVEKKLTKSEIDAILTKKAQDPNTSAQDRAAINSFYLTNAGVDKIAHLLK